MDEGAHNQRTRYVSEPVAIPTVSIAVVSIVVGSITMMPISPTIVVFAMSELITVVPGLMVATAMATGMITVVTST